MTIGSLDYDSALGTLKIAAPMPAISAEERNARLDMARKRTRDLGCDALLIGAGAGLRYFAGVPWGATERLVALLLPVDGSPVMICPFFEAGSLEADLHIKTELYLWQEDESPYKLVAQALAPGSRLAVDPAMAFEMVHRLGRETGLEIREAGDIIHPLRMCKSPAEIALMQQAKSMTLDVHRATAKMLREGVTASEVKRFVNDAHRMVGATGSTFCAVQFGKATAYPHGIPGDQTLRDGNIVLIDTGCTVEGYHSDITRTYAFGQASGFQEHIWSVEKEAQAAAFARVEIGMPCEEIDHAARRVLEKAGLGPDYALPGLPHRTGHGIGLNIHEPAYLVRGDSTPLQLGMCFSNEPMIVIPDQFGIRLEDHMYVTADGAKWFTEPQAAINRL